MGISQVVVPPAITWLMQVEQLTFKALHRSTPPQVSVLALSWPMLSLVSAILVDVSMQMARKQNISRRQLSLMLGGAVLIGCIPFTLVNPTAILQTMASVNILGIVLTIALAFPAIYVGMKLGQNIGQTMSVSER
jgi:uncharacterized membrane protein